jgi:disulfide bond formation protein DsbB
MHNPIISSIVSFLAFGVVVMNGLFVVLLALWVVTFFSKKPPQAVRSILDFISDNSVPFAWIVATGATLGSLFLSEVAALVPCELCWYQRTMMYPQAIILGIATFTSDVRVKKYSIGLSIVGALIAIYHVMLQTFPDKLHCSDKIANCAFVQFKYFGYVTIPVMSLSAFLLILVIVGIGMGKKSVKTSQ